jgi:single-stranded-DNA-specific exonuclease
VAAALEACAQHLTKRGGHPGAGGFSLLPQAWDAFVRAFGELPRPFPAGSAARPDQPGRLAVDLVLTSRYLDWNLADELERLAPYGPGHTEPLLAVTGLRVLDARRVGAESQHLVLRLRKGLETFDAVAFGVAPGRPLPAEGALLDLVGTLQRDSYQGETRLRLRVLDYADASSSPLLARRRPALAPVSMAAAG